MKNTLSPNYVSFYRDAAIIWIECRDKTVVHCVLDATDYPLAARHRWQVNRSCRTLHVSSSKRNQKKVYMHTLLTGFVNTDHKDGDGTNNRRSNLRVCTKAQNKQNEPLRADSTAGYKGATFSKLHQRYRAKIGVDGKELSLGLFGTAQEAGLAYDRAAKKYFGDFARLNFPEAQQ